MKGTKGLFRSGAIASSMILMIALSLMVLTGCDNGTTDNNGGGNDNGGGGVTFPAEFQGTWKKEADPSKTLVIAATTVTDTGKTLNDYHSSFVLIDIKDANDGYKGFVLGEDEMYGEEYKMKIEAGKLLVDSRFTSSTPASYIK